MRIDGGAFSGNVLTAISIPSSVEVIGDKCFSIRQERKFLSAVEHPVDQVNCQ
jgi:hypothetical protein